jgi:hypothetical protein
MNILECRAIVMGAVLASAAWGASAFAQPPPEAPAPEAPAPEPPSTPAARADAMFQSGKRLLEEGQVEAACKQLAESDVLDPTVGTLGLLAACHERQGRVATAWSEFRETARRAEASRDGRAEFARQHAAALEPRLPKLSIRLSRPGRPGVVIRRNDQAVPASEIGVEVAVDPGPYEIVARGGGAEHRSTVTAREGAAVAVDVPDLAPSPAAPPPDPTYTQRLGLRWPAGLAAIGVGLFGVGVGAVSGIAAMNQNLESRQSFDTCQASGLASSACASGRDARANAFQMATLSTAGFGVGVAGLAAGATLLLWPARGAASASGRVSVGPVVGANGGGALAQGAF